MSRVYRYHIEWRVPGEEGWTLLVRTHRTVSAAVIHAMDHVAAFGGTCRLWDSRSRIWGGEVGPDLLWHPIDNGARRIAASLEAVPA